MSSSKKLTCKGTKERDSFVNHALIKPFIVNLICRRHALIKSFIVNLICRRLVREGL